ncbi:MAG TPA: hypothetical protein VHM70_23555 [Polyangiaceae bacterium]|jgi:hypothetical protein|nr:hypothetical protein [Polyangiaceae bacterium]
MRATSRQFAAAWTASFAAALISAGCVSQVCNTDGQDPQRYSGGHTNAAKTFYESSPASGPFLYFPVGRTYQLEHGLSEMPSDYHAFLAFEEAPLEHKEGFAQAAGNEVMFEVVNDRIIQVRNDTCAELYLRVVATVAPFEGAPSADDGDAATSPSDAAAKQ